MTNLPMGHTICWRYNRLGNPVEIPPGFEFTSSDLAAFKAAAFLSFEEYGTIATVAEKPWTSRLVD